MADRADYAEHGFSEICTAVGHRTGIDLPDVSNASTIRPFSGSSVKW